MLRNQSCLVSSPRWHYWNSKIAFGFHDAAYPVFGQHKYETRNLRDDFAL